MRGTRFVFGLLCAVSVGCKKPTYLGAARVEITLDRDSGITCVEVIAQSLDTNTLLTGTTDVNGRETLQVGISETPTFSGRVRVTARGFTTTGCTGTPAVTLPPQELTLGPPPFDEAIQFRFRALPRDAGTVDAGFDAGTEPDAGPGCTVATCFPTGECDTATCLGDGGCLRENRPTMSFCDAGVCNDVGVCVPPDPCPNGMSCSPGLSCTSTGTCSDGGVCVPSFAGCVPPPCHRSLNACRADGGCDFTVDLSLVGTNCGGSNVCYANGECQPQLRAANVQPTLAPWPTTPMQFDNLLTDGGLCNFIFQTSTDDGGFGPVSSSSCPWPTTVSPLVMQQVGGGPEVLAFSTSALTINPGARVFFVGKRPVALLVHGDARIQGQLFARALNGRFPGAGADSAWCDGGIGRSGGGDREGGGGGGFLDLGGAGGRIGTHNGGLPNGNPELTPLRGGCSGGTGWSAPNDQPGLGGGGLQLTVRNRLEIFDGGFVTASGLGGSGGDGGSAASGGGSGGALLFQANDVLLFRGALTANGGGGGEGGTRTNSSTADGNPGGPGSLTTSNPVAGGTNGNCCGGNGGPGGAGTTGPDGGTNGVNSGGNSPGGGGGGGSRGRIRIDTPGSGSCTLTSSIVSPDDVTLLGPNTTCTRN